MLSARLICQWVDQTACDESLPETGERWRDEVEYRRGLAYKTEGDR